MAAILQTTFSHAFSSIKKFEFWLGFHWSIEDLFGNKSALVQIIVWSWIGDNALAETILAKITDYIWCHQVTMS